MDDSYIKSVISDSYIKSTVNDSYIKGIINDDFIKATFEEAIETDFTTKITSNYITTAYINTLGLTSLGKVTAGSFSLGNGNFVVSTAGNLTAKNANIEGKITATSGTIENVTITDANIGKWNIVNGGLYSDYAVGASIRVEQTGGRFLRINESPNSAMLAIRADSGTALGIYTQSSSGVGISIIAQTSSRAINSLGGHNFVQRSVNEWWNSPGILLALDVKYLDIGTTESYSFSQFWSIDAISTVSIKKISASGKITLTHNLGHTDYYVLPTCTSPQANIGEVSKTDNDCSFTIGDTDTLHKNVRILLIGRNKA